MKTLPKSRILRWPYLFLNNFWLLPDRLYPLEDCLIRHLLERLPQPYHDVFKTQLGFHTVFQRGGWWRDLFMYPRTFRGKGRPDFPLELRVPTGKDDVRLASIKFRIPGGTKSFSVVFHAVYGKLNSLSFSENYRAICLCDEIEVIKVKLNREILRPVGQAESAGNAEVWRKDFQLADRRIVESKSTFDRLPIKIVREARAGIGQAVDIDDHTVTVSEHFFTGGAVWSQPLEAFEGVLFRSYAIISGLRRDYIFHTVSLVHPSPDQKFCLDGTDRNLITLFETEKLRHAQKIWQDVARALDLPALEETPLGVRRRDPADFGKPVRAYIDSEEMAGMDMSSATPPGITKSAPDGESPMFQLKDVVYPPNRNTWFLPFLGLFAVAAVGVSVAIPDHAVLRGPILGFLMLALITALIIKVFTDPGKPAFVITPKQAVYSLAPRYRKVRRTTIDLTDLHVLRKVDARESCHGCGYSLFLVSESAEIRLDHLTAGQADWLERYALAGALILEEE